MQLSQTKIRERSTVCGHGNQIPCLQSGWYFGRCGWEGWFTVLIFVKCLPLPAESSRFDANNLNFHHLLFAGISSQTWSTFMALSSQYIPPTMHKSWIALAVESPRCTISYSKPCTRISNIGFNNDIPMLSSPPIRLPSISNIQKTKMDEFVLVPPPKHSSTTRYSWPLLFRNGLLECSSVHPPRASFVAAFIISPFIYLAPSCSPLSPFFI